MYIIEISMGYGVGIQCNIDKKVPEKIYTSCKQDIHNCMTGLTQSNRGNIHISLECERIIQAVKKGIGSSLI